jgi:hypothetical protein
VIARYLKDRRLTVEQFRGMPVDVDFARVPGEIDKATPESFLYQSGYLSLRPGEREGMFDLDYPNREVLESMSKLLTDNILGDRRSTSASYRLLYKALDDRSPEGVILEFNKLLSSVPYDDYARANRKTIEKDIPWIDFGEWLFRSVMRAYLSGAGLDARAEVHGSQGRADMAVKHGGVVWVMELKMARGGDNEAKAKEALEQIRDKGYAAPYEDPVLLGLAISESKRTITAWVASGVADD